MFNKTVFKQTIKANWILWAIFTVVLSVLLTIIIAVYDPTRMATMTATMADALEGTAMAEMAGDKLSSMTTLLGSLGTTFYDMIAPLLALIFVIIMGNSLVASEVDRGSMAYTLSTPIKRKTVIFTKASALICSLLLMFTILTGTGLAATQIFHQAIGGTSYTEDVKAVAKELDKGKDDVANDLDLILDNKKALKVGAEARDIDEDVYIAYLNLTKQENEGKPTEEDTMPAEQKEMMQEKMMTGLTAAASELDMDVSDLIEKLDVLKEDDKAMTAACTASELPKETLVEMINAQLAANEVSKDAPVEFDTGNFIMLNFSCFLLMFALSGISFLASCAANLTKYSFTFGAGIPIVFFIFKIVAQTDTSLESFKYLSLNTLFEASSIAEGDINALPLVVLAALGIVLYSLGIQVFKKKDLPL